MASSLNNEFRSFWENRDGLREEIKRRHVVGETRQQIADALGKTVPTIREHLLNMGLVVSKKHKPATKFTEEMLKQMVDEYPTVGAQVLADRWGCTAKTVICKASLMGIRCEINFSAINGELRASQNTTINMDFFDKWTPNSAYVLGYMGRWLHKNRSWKTRWIEFSVYS